MERRAAARVRAEEAGVELVDWLARRFRYLGAAAWAAEAAAGRLRVGEEEASPGRILREGELVSYRPGPAPEPPVNAAYRVLHDSGDFLVVDKPPDLPVHPGGRYFEHSLWRLLGGEASGLHLVTRLDRETSGLVLLARGREATRHAQALLDGGGLRKDYLAIVHGDFPPALAARGILCGDPGSGVRKRRLFVPEGREAPPGAGDAEMAETSFTLLASLDHPEAGILSLVHALPRTGRTHQIRASLASLGFPLLGDKLYGLDESLFIRFSEGRLTEEDRRRLLLPCQALHAWRLGFRDRQGRDRLFSAAPPGYWPLTARGFGGPGADS